VDYSEDKEGHEDEHGGESEEIEGVVEADQGDEEGGYPIPEPEGSIEGIGEEGEESGGPIAAKFLGFAGVDGSSQPPWAGESEGDPPEIQEPREEGFWGEEDPAEGEEGEEAGYPEDS
jgi:hypothetical protein